MFQKIDISSFIWEKQTEKYEYSKTYKFPVHGFFSCVKVIIIYPTKHVDITLYGNVIIYLEKA